MWPFPKKRDFFKLLADQSAKTEAAMALLCDFIKDPCSEKGEKVSQAEQDADEQRRILIDELNQSFVTPIDREDIFTLSRVIDDMADYAKSTVEEMMLFNVKTNEHLQKIAEALYNASKEISAAILSMRTHSQVCIQHIIRAKKAENFVEHRYREGLVELFKNPDFVEILKTREIYRHLSNAADRGDEAANIIGDILVKIS